MKFSTKAHYGLRAMVTLAQMQQEQNRQVSVSDLAQKEELPENYLEQLVRSLMRGGLLTSTRGAHGGYSLARAADKISVLDILHAVGEQLIFPECTGKGCDRARKKHAECLCAPLWRVLNMSLIRAASGVTLEDLLKKQLPEHLKPYDRRITNEN